MKSQPLRSTHSDTLLTYPTLFRSGFAQFTARGFVDPLRVPCWVHLHGAAMLGWLALLIVQPTLVSRRNLVLHRRLGWVGAALALVIACLGVFIAAMALVLQARKSVV